MQTFGGDWDKWRKNPLHASCKGSVWEQELCWLAPYFSIFDEDSWKILWGGIITSNIYDRQKQSWIQDLWQLIISMILPAVCLHLLQNFLKMKSKVIIPPPSNYSRPNLYSHRGWKQIQHIPCEFWCHWITRKKEMEQCKKKLYLPMTLCCFMKEKQSEIIGI